MTTVGRTRAFQTGIIRYLITEEFPPTGGQADYFSSREASIAEALSLWSRIGERNIDGTQVARRATAAYLSPEEYAAAVARGLEISRDRVIVSGPHDERLLLVQHADAEWVGVSLGSGPLGQLPLPADLEKGVKIRDPNARIGVLRLDREALHRLTRPRVTLVSLFKPSVFPLPRFALGISDVARAIRADYTGRVTLVDMQLGLNLAETAAAVSRTSPDLIGISATFGQHDIMRELLDRLLNSGIPKGVLLIVGGSLAALNAEFLTQCYPSLMVAEGPGERTMRELVAHWHEDRPLDEVHGVLRAGVPRAKARPHNLDSGGFLPELDLLEQTLDQAGVMQLESSRGCTHACSFCPRSHKGLWAGASGSLEATLAAVQPLYASRPNLSRKIFLVDEEFVGYDKAGEALRRCESIATQISGAGFVWETSTRVDQVTRPDRDRAWHLRRIEFWRKLVERGLTRCLFGVESGVDSILRRFNKHSTAEQNVLAIRTLTAMGVPIRCTYITFDPLMTMAELAESYEFQGRKDLMLEAAPDLSSAELYEAVRDEGWVAEMSTGRPFYEEISYMLVSMECLIGSAYLRTVEDAGLARDVTPLMGRRNADYLNPVIGAMGEWSQRWIDRNFSFEYILKSLEKVSHREERESIRSMRRVLKRGSYALFGEMIERAAADGTQGWSHAEVIERHWAGLRESLVGPCNQLIAGLSSPLNRALEKEYRNWEARSKWELINDD